MRSPRDAAEDEVEGRKGLDWNVGMLEISPGEDCDESPVVFKVPGIIDLSICCASDVRGLA
jgi:hypothetical protein